MRNPNKFGGTARRNIIFNNLLHFQNSSKLIKSLWYFYYLPCVFNMLISHNLMLRLLQLRFNFDNNQTLNSYSCYKNTLFCNLKHGSKFSQPPAYESLHAISYRLSNSLNSFWQEKSIILEVKISKIDYSTSINILNPSRQQRIF